ncbi:glycoside hydrolase family 47 protein, partial [Hypoxylon sp. CI-4A]
HWTKSPENFPVPEDEIIPLPTGKPKTMPTIQYDFGKESSTTQEKRLDRLAQVKAEMVRGWNGYMAYARGHDELSPISKKFRDPFCGWAATLVDALDTLWIMGMKTEFEDALVEVAKIDFTTSQFRSEIPVFETTIRYLGGLIAAYDVSGGKAGGYGILLEKAVELAEILMGVFDTPNRMPILYYSWKPTTAKLPKRAQAGVSVAELGSLSMEFTRLAQITKEDRYYDAVARITDAFYEWGERGTSVPGIFPEHVDASGCNRTAEAELAAQEAELQEQEQIAVEKAKAAQSNNDVDLSAKGGFGAANKRSDTATGTKQSKCIPQGLTSGSWSYKEQYSMGGSQDSTYEYFPKQWLLLGGLEPKYKSLHLKTVAAVKKWLLYRPMVPDDRDILFSAKLVTEGNPEVDAVMEWEVTHLTCFIGGMFGMGGKIFDIPEDVEIGKRLTDGCVWAYDSTPSGIMPEGATVVPCAEVNNCRWNDTVYWQHLDPLWETHNEQMEKYERKHEEWQAAKEQKAESKGYRDVSVENDGNAADEDIERVGIQKRAPPSSNYQKHLSSPKGSTAGISANEDADQAPLKEEEGEPDLPEPVRPKSHEEYAQNRINSDRLPPGFVSANYHGYILRPEAIESVWYMYRITGDTSWQDKGWNMFKAIVSQTQTEVGSSAIDNVLVPDSKQKDEMESFWLAETLKYFYLLYSEPDLISLDDWVLNTEAHPFKRPI